MNAYQISQIIALALAIAVLVILIVVLTRNTLTKVPTTGTAEEIGSKKITMLDNKINWLYALEIASVGIMILFGLIGFFGYMRYNTCA